MFHCLHSLKIHNCISNASEVKFQLFYIRYMKYYPVHEFNVDNFSPYQLTQTSAKPVWYIYPGMGSQCLLMIKDLLRIPSFETSIRECHQILEPRMINLMSILASQSPSTFQNVLNCFVGITSMMVQSKLITTNTSTKHILRFSPPSDRFNRLTRISWNKTGWTDRPFFRRDWLRIR